MDANRFDALARALDVTRSRRGALSAILGAVGAVALAPDLAGAGNRGRKRQRKRRRPDNRRCVDCVDRPLTRSAGLEGCDLAGRDLSGADLRSADLQRACPQHADLSGAELRSADLEGADVRGASFTDANLDRADIRGWRSDGAVFCRTTMPDGSIDSGDCLPDGGATCLGLNQLCSIFGGAPCCDYGQPGSISCDSGTGFFTACQALCRSDADCQTLVGSPDAFCANDVVSDFGCAGRHFDPNLHCRARKTCENPQDCQGGGACCRFSGVLPAQCCLKDERCLTTFGCVRERTRHGKTPTDRAEAQPIGACRAGSVWDRSRPRSGLV